MNNLKKRKKVLFGVISFLVFSICIESLKWRGRKWYEGVLAGRNSDCKLQPRCDGKALCDKCPGKEAWKAPVYFKPDASMQPVTPRWTWFRLEGEQTEVSTVVITCNYNFGFFFYIKGNRLKWCCNNTLFSWVLSMIGDVRVWRGYSSIKALNENMFCVPTHQINTMI